jgi:tetratricopeptide (TPR) repeat protein
MVANYTPTDYTDFSLKSKNNYRLAPDKDSIHRWSNDLNDVSRLLSETDETYHLLLRALRRKKGFGLFFAIEPIPKRIDRIIQLLQHDLSHKKIATIEVDKNTKTLFERVEQLYQESSFDILCVKGIENALYDYEDTQRLSGWTDDEIYTYSWKGVPPILSHLNQQRERFSSEFPSSSFVFFLPSFAIDYFIQRAPDFFDWRSGLFDFPTNDREVSDTSSEITNGSLKTYLKLNQDEKIKKTLEIQELLRQNTGSESLAILHLDMALLYLSGKKYTKALEHVSIAFNLQEDSPKQYKIWLLRGRILGNLERYEEALTSFDRAVAINPDDQVWVLRGVTLFNLERYKEALDSFDKAVTINPDDRKVWVLRGRILGNLERHEEALASFDRAVAINPDDQVWVLRGVTLFNLERYKEALDSFDKAIAINHDDYQSWRLRGNTLNNLERYEEALASFDKAISINPNEYQSWCLYGNILNNLKRYKEALDSFDKAIAIDPNDYQSWRLHGNALDNLKRYEEALDSFDKAIVINPDDYQSWCLHGNTLNNLKRYEEALASVDKAIAINPDDYQSWRLRGLILDNLERYEEALASFDKAIAINSDDYQSWCLHGNTLNSLK